MNHLRKGLLAVLAYSVISCLYLSTYLIDPDPERTEHDEGGPYWLNEVKDSIKKRRSL